MTTKTKVVKKAKKNLLKKAKLISSLQKEQYEVHESNTIKMNKEAEVLTEHFKTIKGKQSFLKAIEGHLKGTAISRSVRFCLLAEQKGKSVLGKVLVGKNGYTTRGVFESFLENFFGVKGFSVSGEGENYTTKKGTINKNLFKCLKASKD